MIPIIKNNFKRLSKKANQVLLIFILTAASLFVAMYQGNQPPSLARVAVFSNSIDIPKIEGFTFIEVKEKPKMATIMVGKYDGWIESKGKHNYQVTLPKNDELEQQLNGTLAQPKQVLHTKKGQPETLKKVIGFVMMFLLMGGLTYGFLYGEDKERKQLKRILNTSLSPAKYMVAHSLFNFVMLYIPTMLMFITIQKLTGLTIGSSLTIYGAVIGLICLLSVSFSLLLMSLFESSDSANMIGSATIILTTVLSGSFISLNGHHPILDKIIACLPQHALLEICEGVVASKENKIITSVLYVLMFSLLCLILASFILKKEKRD